MFPIWVSFGFLLWTIYGCRVRLLVFKIDTLRSSRHENTSLYLDVPIYHLKCSSGYRHYFKIFSSSNICYHLKQQSVCNADRVRYMYQYHIVREPLSANSYIDLHGGSIIMNRTRSFKRNVNSTDSHFKLFLHDVYSWGLFSQSLVVWI